MSKLIGTNPNQVPSNADLGSAAFMDKKDFLLSKGSSLSEIDAVALVGATSVFVYDTSKDSDGGAWRKRCQHLSWYNEPLNTHTRGSRREFPAVAIIVATPNEITIYDGDDPTVPMWMKFIDTNVSAGYMAYLNVNGGASCKAVQALNSQVVAGFDSSVGGMYVFNFLEDRATVRYTSSIGYNYMKGNLADRNTTYDRVVIDTTNVLYNRDVKDVAVTVLPNAPIDPSTNLPKITIAAATDKGVTVFKDDGAIKSVFHSYGGSMKIAIDGYNLFAVHNGATGGQTAEVIDLLELVNAGDGETSPIHGDNSLGNGPDSLERYYGYGSVNASAIMPFLTPNFGVQSEVAINGNDLYWGTSNRLYRINEVPSKPANSLSNYITSDYNTGWMIGDCKLATLCTTDAGEVSGRNLVTNGTFDSSTTGWSPANGTISVESAKLRLNATETDGSPNGVAWQAITTEIGKTYVVTAEGSPGSGTFGMGVGTTTSNVNIAWSGYSATARTITHAFTATASTTYVSLLVDSTNGTQYAFFDNVSLRLAEPDQSVNSNSMETFGTLTKIPVASGAELTAYTGFTISNYLRSPRTPDLNFGTGDFSVSYWVKRNSTSANHRTVGWAEGATQNRFDIYLNNAAQVVTLYAADAGSTRAITGTLQVGTWNHVVGLRRNGQFELWVNGVLEAEIEDVFSFNYDKDLHFYAGAMSFNDGVSTEDLPLDGALSLIRFSKTAPSREQIVKIYNDEKALFEEGAKATLYGTSDDVNSIAYDKYTNLLHAGTSAGRSVFQGLRRVDNTTTAVTQTISAVDGFVVED